MTKNNLTPEQQKKLIEIGSDLQRIRLAKSISLDSIAANTLISKRLLEAIETGDFAELPEPFYIKALVGKFAQEIDAKQIQFEVSSIADTEVTPSPRATSIRRKYWLNFQLRSLHLYLLYILLVILSVKGITLVVERPIAIEEIPLEKPAIDSKVAQTEVSQANTTPESVPQFVSQSSNSESVTVGINLQERCWLKVMVDGNVAFEGILPKGTQRSWSGDKQVTIRAGNAGGVVISFNNEQKKVLGAPGEVEEITYTVN
ncbi:helix-turn-helix domain-containing protein [Waterburya agarophytonicola K14]|uniref:Helix-turn-helix domain-containing protein n=1 Tax=Waterburya agarophytonicola KI4 TaxID=2874699 RepID=A0A964FEI2_9CYAN|nr:helix-turn-helix domain-containing protein [Waterburya agarophytonicola]MCC0176081.1 helix-turn-helix domain-containing protein [Waterburya agarophytonicola KI4]